MYHVREVLKGPVAALAYPVLDPPALAKLLRVLDRAVPKSSEEKRKPRLQILAALVEGQVMSEPVLRETAKLPTLETLRAQIVGLLSAPAAQTAGVLDAARGGRTVGLLESYRKGLEEGEAAP
ncbi:hypothetical protein DACRYDRAFT_64527 [Dacryopinax primogenitus]|uniref:Uncharacterized protein n=1 Tax=Dacryopinax primogenitus (strain DJM 731) TaxID=1858805 RepID=M5G4F2_DACPD|nr:uncharacterized protein DACRYDRAFT_64527 [Dacryopinax primogenitus]EJU03579.1 hypothetical protein DACRYDRAFT_64527 [Dacryopinax primogenitus]